MPWDFPSDKLIYISKNLLTQTTRETWAYISPNNAFKNQNQNQKYNKLEY